MSPIEFARGHQKTSVGTGALINQRKRGGRDGDRLDKAWKWDGWPMVPQVGFVAGGSCGSQAGELGA